MVDPLLQQKPGRLVPVLIGGSVMAATALVPVLNMVNCLCCAGIMGGAVLACYLHKKNFPAGVNFTVGDGALVGLLGGLFGAVVYAVITGLIWGASTQGMSVTFDESFERAIRQMESTGQDPQAVEKVRQFVEQLASSPFLLFILVLFASLLLFAVFGTLGGVIGGNIFKTKTVPEIPPAQGS